MRKLGLIVKHRAAYKVTTRRKHTDAVADNLFNMNFNPIALNEIWANGMSYLKTTEGLTHLAVVMALYSRRIVRLTY